MNDAFWDELLKVRGEVNKVIEQARADKKVGGSLEALFAMFGGRYQMLQAQCLADPECSLEQAREKLLNEMGRESTPSNKNTPAHIYAGNGNFVGDGIRRCLFCASWSSACSISASMPSSARIRERKSSKLWQKSRNWLP